MKAIDIGLIQARRTKLAEQINETRATLAALEAKQSELEIAERVFAELTLESADEIPSASLSTISLENLLERASRRKDEQRAKPLGIPTVPQMILEALQHAHSLGAEGLEPAAIASYIRGRYWPGAPSEKITPIVWRMWNKDKKLEKHGTLYALPEGDQPKTTGDKLRVVGAESQVIGEEVSSLDILDRPVPTDSDVVSLLEGGQPHSS